MPPFLQDSIAATNKLNRTRINGQELAFNNPRALHKKVRADNYKRGVEQRSFKVSTVSQLVMVAVCFNVER